MEEMKTQFTFADEYEWKIEEEGFFIVKLLEYTISVLDDRGIQRVLRDIENADLAMALKGLKNDVRYRLLNNLSPRMATLIYEEMVFLGSQSTQKVSEAVQRIMIQIVKLMCRDEIPDNDYMIISRMTKIFGVGDKELASEERDDVECELEKLFETYKGAKYGIIE